jgi:hypothetical protein
MPVYNRTTESVDLSDWLKEELAGPTQLSRKNGTLVAGQNLAGGAVLGRFSTGANTGKLTQLNPSATDGTQYADSILITPANATAGDVPAVVISQNASVSDRGLTWPTGIDGPTKAAAISQFAAVNITFLRSC